MNHNLVGKHIKEIRKDKKMTQYQLAELANLSVSHISYIENGKRNTSVDTLFVIANAMEVDAGSLFYGNETNNSHDFQEKIWNEMKDCTNYEKRVIYDQIVSLKRSLRENA